MLSRIFLTVLTLAASAHSWALDQYTVRFSNDLEEVEVKACLAAPMPRELDVLPGGKPYVNWLRQGDKTLPLGSEKDTISLSAASPGECLRWQLDLRSAADAAGYRTAFRAGETLLTSTRLWYWTSSERQTEVRVIIPEGLQFSTPWPKQGQVFRPVDTPSWWSSRTVIGRFEQSKVNLPGGQLELALAGEFTVQQAQNMKDFVTQAAMASVSVTGVFPRESAQIIVVPIGARSEPVPWAHVIRGGGPAIEFFVDPNRPLAEFEADWTATHEFSHFALPYVAYNDRWLSEGLASWYQNVLRARDTRLSEREAWQRLHDGFERGRKATRRETLAEATRAGRSRTMRIYWGGAAFWLQAEVNLRRLTGSQWSVDKALTAFNQCCVQPGQSWRARDLIGKLDELTGGTVFQDVYDQQVMATRFPDLSGLYEQLGIELRKTRIELNNDAPDAQIRRSIMRSADTTYAALP